MDVKFIDYLKKPFLVVKKKRTAFTLWVLSTLIAGNFGLVFNIIIRGNMNELSPLDSLNQDLKVGSLFLFSIVLLASSFGSVRKQSFRSPYEILKSAGGTGGRVPVSQKN